jgi:hypothetical protein
MKDILHDGSHSVRASSCICFTKKMIEKSDDENIAENTIQYIDNECVNECSQARAN